MPSNLKDLIGSLIISGSWILCLDCFVSFCTIGTELPPLDGWLVHLIQDSDVMSCPDKPQINFMARDFHMYPEDRFSTLQSTLRDSILPTLLSQQNRMTITLPHLSILVYSLNVLPIIRVLRSSGAEIQNRTFLLKHFLSLPQITPSSFALIFSVATACFSCWKECDKIYHPCFQTAFSLMPRTEETH